MNGKGSIRRNLAAWWLRLHRKGVAAGRAFAAAQEARAQAGALQYLDARMLKDIGLQPWQGALGEHIASQRQQDALAWRAALDGIGGGWR